MLLVQIGKHRFAIPAEAILRVLPMAELTLLPEAPTGTVGVIAFRGALLPVVDPRPYLGLPSVSPHLDQHLVLIAAQTRYLLWIDRAATIVAAPSTADVAGVGMAANVRASQFVRVGDEYLPVLAIATFDPGSQFNTRDIRSA